ncbi:MAG: sporulation protein YabP [Bacillota bacterium]|nr:MAG: sporulation protein YabP [Bacillota bacterium]MBS3950599.1 sporulation protein YabP [Peptococcaceae bacterium]
MVEENYNHRVTITNREQVVVEGVIHVDKFDDEEIVLETDLGMMALRGEDLHIKQLSLESGQLTVEGVVKTVEYLEEGGRVGKGKGKGFFDRIFG